jgi:hypothetical protein
MMNISSSRSRPWLSLFAWLLPASSLKTWALRKPGNDIADDAIIGPNLVIGCGRFRVGEGTVIGPFNLFRGCHGWIWATGCASGATTSARIQSWWAAEDEAMR